MSILNWVLNSRFKKKKRLTYSKEIIKTEYLTMWAKIKRFFEELFLKK